MVRNVYLCPFLWLVLVHVLRTESIEHLIGLYSTRLPRLLESYTCHINNIRKLRIVRFQHGILIVFKKLILHYNLKPITISYIKPPPSPLIRLWQGLYRPRLLRLQRILGTVILRCHKLMADF